METAPMYYPLFQFIGFVICIIWIYAQCNESKNKYMFRFSTISVVNILAALGVFWDISNTIMGILILAPANSIGDFVADTSLARSNKVITAFGAIYAGPLLNLLIGLWIVIIYDIFPFAILKFYPRCWTELHDRKFFKWRSSSSCSNCYRVCLRCNSRICSFCSHSYIGIFKVSLLYYCYIIIYNISRFEFKKWVGIFFVVSYIICLAVILLAGMDVFGKVPQWKTETDKLFNLLQNKIKI